MVSIINFPENKWMNLRREIRYSIGDVLFVFKIFENRIEKIIYEKGKNPLCFAMYENEWVRIFNCVEE